jgi:hypothetical protein
MVEINITLLRSSGLLYMEEKQVAPAGCMLEGQNASGRPSATQGQMSELGTEESFFRRKNADAPLLMMSQ